MTVFYYFALSFFVYGFLGWCTEVAYVAVKQGKFVNRGFLNGPICPVYGFGVGVVVQFLTPVENNLVLLYISSTILVTAIEGITGFLLEKIFHNKWWDYSDQPLNIGGYVCVLFSLIWGVFCVLASDGYPVSYEKGYVINGLEKFNGKDGYYCFNAGTKLTDKGIVTNGGRVLGVTAKGATLKEARANAYAATEWITFENKYMRHDIGKAIDEA